MPEHTPAPTYARSLYGFFLYILSNIILIIYCAWAFLPDSFLHYCNIYYYPQKYWSVAVPIQFLLVLASFAFLIYPSANLILSADIDSQRTLTDSHAVTHTQEKENEHNLKTPCVCKDKSKCVKDDYNITPMNINENSIPHIQDLHISMVCRKLY